MPLPSPIQSPLVLPDRRDRYLRAVAAMQRALSATPSADLRGLQHVLAPLGEASDVSRVYLFENHRRDGELMMSQRAEWCAPGIVPEIDNPELQDLSYDEFFPRWATELGAGRPIVDRVSDMPASEREVLEAQQIQSILVVPLTIQGQFIGFIGFDDCSSPRVWTELEVDLLGAAATNIGLYLDQRRIRETLESTNRELVAARDQVMAAMKARTTFLAKVSHELRTPLNAVIGYSELVLDDAENDTLDSVQEDVGRILGSGRYLLAMVDDLLTLSHLGAGESVVHPVDTPLDPWLDEIVGLVCHPAASHAVDFHVERSPSIGRAYTDARRLTQIVLNLVSNALKYTPSGSVVLRVDADDEAVTLEVEDTGLGMSRADLDRIFEEFFQADATCTRQGGGVGLGLTITKLLCDALGATLSVTSTLGVGSRFTVRLPRRPPGGLPGAAGTDRPGAR